MTTLIERWRRLRTPRRLRHMTELNPALELEVPRSHAAGSIRWRGCQIAELVPLARSRDQGLGRSCFVIASGPSLADVDLTKLDDHACFAVNGAIARYAGLHKGPSHYVITDPDFIEHRFHLVEAAFATKPFFFLSAAAISAICERNPSLLSRSPVSLIETHFCRYGEARLEPHEIEQLVATHDSLHASSWRIGFSRDIEVGLFSAHTVAYYPIQIASYMGFSEVYLLGVDLGSTGAQVRFYELAGSARPSRMDRDLDKYILPSFAVLAQVCREAPDFRVYNLSAISRLPAETIPRLGLDEALNRAAERRDLESTDQ